MQKTPMQKTAKKYNRLRPLSIFKGENGVMFETQAIIAHLSRSSLTRKVLDGASTPYAIMISNPRDVFDVFREDDEGG